MPMPAQDLKLLIQQAFPDAVIDLRDTVGDQDHYELVVISKAFVGKSRVQQHQLVYKALGGSMGTQLHALSLHTKIPGDKND